MSKAVTGLLMIIGILMLLAFLNIGSSTTAVLLSKIGFNNLADAQSATFFDYFLNTTAGILALAGLAAGIAIGVFTKQSGIEYALVIPVMAIGGWVLGDLYKILTTIETSVGDFVFVTFLTKFLIVIMMVGTIMALISWWRGVDG
jgi:hypothetical protein